MTIAMNASSDAGFSDRLSDTSRASLIDQWIYVFTAFTFIAIVLVGFIPDSLGMIGAVRARITPPLPIVLHVHAVLMGSLLLVLLAQSVLVAMDNRRLHFQLGIIAFALVPAILVTGCILVPTMYQFVSNAAQNAPAAARPHFKFLSNVLEDVFLGQLRTGWTFGICMWIALRERKHDVGVHKRLIFLAIASAIPAAIDRMHWLPSTLPGSILSADIYTVLAFSPMLLWDLVRNRRLHRAYLIWAAVFGLASVPVYVLWNTPWWHVTARHILGA